MTKSLLSKIHSPQDVKALTKNDLPRLIQEIRTELIETVTKNGGHLASNLGLVELTVAIHRIFSSPQDHIIFDVGHQSYVHKLLTDDMKRSIHFGNRVDYPDLQNVRKVRMIHLVRDTAALPFPQPLDLPMPII